MSPAAIRQFIETVGPAVEEAFPEWDKGHREILVVQLVTATLGYESKVEQR